MTKKNNKNLWESAIWNTSNCTTENPARAQIAIINANILTKI